jgi:hypothetical protein
MANTRTGGTMQKIVHTGGLGKSTLVGNLHVSIPMPRGATPPPTPSGQGQAPAPAATQGPKKNG